MRTTGPARLLAALGLAATAAFTTQASASAQVPVSTQAPASAAVDAPATTADVVQPFEAKHADTCLSSFTAGDLTWHDNVIAPSSVGIEGDVVLENSDYCYFIVPPTAVAHFTAYANGYEVDSGSVVTLGRDHFSLTLAAGIDDSMRFVIDQVDVQVCHGSSFTPDPVASNCGETVTYKR